MMRYHRIYNKEEKIVLTCNDNNKIENWFLCSHLLFPADTDWLQGHKLGPVDGILSLLQWGPSL